MIEDGHSRENKYTQIFEQHIGTKRNNNTSSGLRDGQIDCIKIILIKPICGKIETLNADLKEFIDHQINTPSNISKKTKSKTSKKDYFKFEFEGKEHCKWGSRCKFSHNFDFSGGVCKTNCRRKNVVKMEITIFGQLRYHQYYINVKSVINSREIFINQPARLAMKKGIKEIKTQQCNISNEGGKHSPKEPVNQCHKLPLRIIQHPRN